MFLDRPRILRCRIVHRCDEFMAVVIAKKSPRRHPKEFNGLPHVGDSTNAVIFHTRIEAFAMAEPRERYSGRWPQGDVVGFGL